MRHFVYFVSNYFLANVIACSGQALTHSPQARTVPIQILAVNDFHGALMPPGTIGTPTGNVNAGGAEYLATWIKTMKADNPKTVVVSAGDMIGATPLLSALFHDEPAIETFNEIGLGGASSVWRRLRKR